MIEEGHSNDVENVSTRLYAKGALAKMYENASSTSAVTTSFNKQSQILLLQKSSMGEKSIFRTLSEVDDFKTIFKIVKNLTPTYMIERRDKGLYYLCDDPFTQTHNLVYKKLQVHVLKTNIRYWDDECNNFTKIPQCKINR